jgi:tetratricopeptide (TPR) repeat protein
VTADLVRWVHHKAPDAADSNVRNLDILRRWNEEEPGDPRVVGYLGTELAIRGETTEAVEFFREYLSLKTGWDEERAQIHRKLSACLLAHDEVVEAQSVALDALRVVPSWPETYLSLAECAYTLGEWGKAIDWARDVLRRGMPSTGLIVNPLDFTFKPRLIVAAALGQLGRIDDAIATAREALVLVPDHQELRRNLAAWEASSQREAVAETFCAQARLLVNHDEQAKALALLEDCVPYFATDHPMVVAERSRIRERLAWLRSPAAYDRHYKEGGSKPEDAVLDFVGVCDRLPRAQFLLAGLAEQVAA